MKKLISIFLLASLFLFSCVTEKQRLKICQGCTLNQVIKDSIHEIVTEKTFTITIHDSVPYFLPNPCAELCDEFGNLRPFHQEIKGDRGTKLKIYSKGNRIHFTDVADSLKLKAKHKETTRSTYKERIKEVPARCQRDHLTRWDIFFIRIGQGFCILLLLLIGRQIFYYTNKFKQQP